MAVAEALKPVLERTKLEDLCSDRQAVSVLEHNLTVFDALKLLAKKHILSAPLVAGYDLEDVAGGNMADAAPSLLGWVDVSDVVRALIQHIQQRHNPLPRRMLALMSVLEEEGPEFAKKPLVALTGGSDRGLVYQMNSDHSLMQVIREVFLKPVAHGSPHAVAVHRLAVFDTYGEVVNIVSQTDIIRFLHKNMALLGNLADKTLADLGLLNGKPPVVSVSPHLPTLLAYQHMLEAGVSGAAVVAESGELIANLSLSELRSIQPEHFGALALPVGEFLALLHGTAYVGYSTVTSSAATHPFFARSASQQEGSNESDVQVITATPDTTFRQMVTTLVDNHVHRIYVSYNRNRPTADVCITLTDLLRVMTGMW